MQRRASANAGGRPIGLSIRTIKSKVETATLGLNSPEFPESCPRRQFPRMTTPNVLAPTFATRSRTPAPCVIHTQESSGYWTTLGLLPVLAYTSGRARETLFMTSAVRELLRSFQSLSDAEKHEAASLLLRQVVQGEAGDVGDDALIAVAEELFLDLDSREAGDGQSSAG